MLKNTKLRDHDIIISSDELTGFITLIFFSSSSSSVLRHMVHKKKAKSIVVYLEPLEITGGMYVLGFPGSSFRLLRKIQMQHI